MNLIGSLLVAAAVTIAFWAGYLRRRAMFMAEAREAERLAVFDLGLRFVDGKIVFRLSYEKPIRLGGFALAPSGSVTLEDDDLDVLEGMIRHARIAREGIRS